MKQNSFIITAIVIFSCRIAFGSPLDPSFFRNFTLVNGHVYQKSPELKKWVDGQNSVVRSQLETHPLFSVVKARNAEIGPANPPVRFSAQGKEVFIKSGSLFLVEGNREKMLVDRAAAKGFVVSDFKVSPDFRKVLYAISVNGSDSMYWSVYDLEKGAVMEDGANRVRIYDVNWGVDSKGYYYSKWPELSEEYQLVQNQIERAGGVDVAYHVLGTPTQNDVVVFKNSNKSANYAVSEVPGKNLLIAHRTKLGFTHKLSIYLGYRNSSGAYIWKDLAPSQNVLGRVVAVTSKHVYALSSEPGNNYGVVTYSLAWPWKRKTIIKANPKLVLAQAQRIGDRLVVQEFDSKFRNYLATYDLRGEFIERIAFENLGLSAQGSLPQVLSGNAFSDKAYFVYSSIKNAPVTISYDPHSKSISVMKNDKEVPFDGAQIGSKTFEFRSHDGARVPIQLFFRKDRSPSFAYVYYYGSNGVVNSSVFNRKFQLMLELGGAVALVGARGGGEGGADWYQQGMKNRMNSVKDVAWASRWLKLFYPTIRDNVVASGRSYGGMLSFAVLTHFPEDFKVVIPVVGIGDLFYYLTDYHGSIGWDDLGFERDHRGQIIDTSATRAQLREWSPLENIQRMKSCPAILSFTAEFDERTGPHQTYLMTHRLQEKCPTQTIQMSEQGNAGHNARTEAVDEAVFVAKQIGLQQYLPLRR